jgi:DnaJ-class molecular chaperone
MEQVTTRKTRMIRVKEVDDLELLECPTCMGAGKLKGVKCPGCHGTGDRVIHKTKYYYVPARTRGRGTGGRP